MTDEHREDADQPKRDKVYVLRSLEQARVLSDALRVRILSAYGGEARTTKQLAEILGEKPGKLYHHVDALEKAELIRLERTRPNRGTLEKYYLPVADTFKAASDLFTALGESDKKTAVIRELAMATFDSAAEEYRQTLNDPKADDPMVSTLSRLRITGSAERIAKVRQQIEQIEDAKSTDKDADEPDDDAQTYGLFIAFYPLIKPKPDPRDPDSGEQSSRRKAQ